MNGKGMKVLIVNTSTGWGGLEMNVVKVAHQLHLKGIEVHVAYQKNTRFEKEVSAFPFQKLALEKGRKYFDFRTASILNKYLKKENIQLIFNSYRPDLDVLMWTKRKNKQLKIIHEQQMQIGIPKKGVFQAGRYKAVDKWLAPLEWLKEEALEKTPLKEHQISIVPLGVDVEKLLSDLPTRTEAQAFFNFQSDAFVIGVLGRIDAKKGQLFLAEAVHELLKKGEKVELLIVGNPTVDNPECLAYYEELKHYIATNNLQQQIRITPAIQEIQNFYQAIDLFVMSSEGETYGMVTVEAMLTKTPVIGTNSGGTPELLAYGKRGTLYEFNQTTSFIEQYFLLRENLKNNIFDLAKIQQEAIENYSLEVEIDGLMKVVRVMSSEL